MSRAVPSSGQEAPPVLSCARPVHRTGRLFVDMPFETPGDDMSQDVFYSAGTAGVGRVSFPKTTGLYTSEIFTSLSVQLRV